MRLRSYLFALAVVVLLPVMVVYGLLVAGNRGSARLLVEILRSNETIRQSLWMLIAEAGGLVVIGGLLAAFIGGRITRQRTAAAVHAHRDESRAAGERTRVLAELGHALSVSLDPDVVARSAVDNICGLLSVQVARLFRLEPESGDFITVAVSTEGIRIYGEDFMIPRGAGAIGLAVRDRRPVVSADVLADARVTLPDDLKRRLERTGYRAVLAVPMDVGDRVVGAFALADRTGRTFTDDEVAFAQAMADQTAVAFENARLHAETAQRLRDTELLLAVSGVIGSTLDLVEVFRRTAREMVRTLGADMGGAWLVAPGGASLSALAAYHVPKEVLDTLASSSPAPPLGSELTRLRAPLFVEHSATDQRLDHLFLRSIPHTSVLIAPVRSKDETIGGFAIFWVREAGRLATGHLRLVEAIARQAAVAVENARLLEAERRSRERLVISEAHYRQLFENVNDIVYVIDLAGRILEVNEAGVQASGYTRDELLGMNVAPLMPEADFTRATERIRRAIHGGSLSGFLATELIRKDGGRVFLEINARLIMEDGSPAAVEGVARNVTARRQSEARQAAFIEIVHELAAQEDFETLTALISDRVCSLLATDSAGVVVIEGDEFVFHRRAGIGDASPGTERRKIAESRLQRIVVTKHLAVSEDMAADPHWRDSRAVTEAGYHAVLEVPIILRDDVIGVLSALHKTPRAFSAEDVALLTRLADHTALAFDRAHLVKDLNARVAEMSGLLTVSQAISSTLDVTETMRRVAREAGRLFGADMVGAYLADAKEEVLLPIAGYHVPEHLREPFREFAVPLKGHPILETAWEDHRPVWSDDLESDARIHREAWSRFPHRSALFVPMVATEQPIGGLFIIWWHRRRAFLPAEIRLAEGVARQAALAVANSRSYDDAQRRRREAEELADIARLLTLSLDATTVARTMVNHVLGLFNADSAVLRLLRADGGLTQIARVGCEHLGFASHATLPPGAGLTGRAVREKHPVWTPDILKEPDLQHEERFREALVATGLHAFVAVPLRTKHRIIGVLAVAFASVRTFSDAEVTLLQTFADQATLALENARLYQDAEHRRREAELLSELAQSINASLDLDTVLLRIVEGARDLCAGDLAMIGVRAPGADAMVIRCRVGSSIPHRTDPGITPVHGLGGRVLDTGHPARTEHDGRNVWIDDPDGEAFGAEGVVAVLAVPIKIADRVEGVLYVARRSLRHFDDDDEAVLLRVAEHAAIAIKNVKQFAGEQEARGGLRRLSRRLMEVQEAERRRIALELHDEIGQSLTALKLNLQLAKTSTSGPEAAPRLQDSLQLADRVLEQVRSLSLDLRPSLLDDLGLSAALRWYVAQQAERAGIGARVATEIGEERLPAPIETTCFRVVQEAVTNILRHAHAHEVRVDVRAFSDRIELSVEDDGTGFDVAAARRGVHGGRSLGLLSMEERVSLIAGELSIDSAPGRGTRIHVTCPLTAATSAAGESRS